MEISFAQELRTAEKRQVSPKFTCRQIAVDKFGVPAFDAPAFNAIRCTDSIFPSISTT